MYKIIFIDEEKDAIDEFKDYVDDTNSTQKFEVIGEFPQEELDEMIQVIFKHNPDALITDFNLNEYKTDINYNVPYNGIHLIQEILAIRDSFPCFVMTSYDDNAIKASEDVNLVYIKDILHGSEKETNAKANFLERVESQINHYKAKIAAAEKELDRLLDLRRSGEATIEDENEIIRLDHFLETTIDKRNAIPEEYKSLSNTQRLGEILSKVDELLKKIEKKDGE
jgi:DNA-binding NarL/FixJ family response regulator